MKSQWADARSVFLSDLHVGWRYSKSSLVLQLLERIQPETLYLVGDIIESVAAPGSRNEEQIRLVRNAIRRLQEIGTEIVAVPGNHDPSLAEMAGEADGWKVVPYAIHRTLVGARYLVAHGDVFDHHTSQHGSRSHNLGRWVHPNLIRFGTTLQRLGIQAPSNEHWCTRWKMLSRKARDHIEAFERFMVELASQHDCEGVICGHIHRPNHKMFVQGEYLNCGDWVEHQSFVFENHFGQLELVPSVSTIRAVDDMHAMNRSTEKVLSR